MILRTLAFLFFSAFSAQAFSAEKILSSYSTVTESDCNLVLTFMANGKGTFVTSCGAEGGSPTGVDEKKDITWVLHGETFTVVIAGKAVTFTKTRRLSCSSFGMPGSRAGLVSGPGLGRESTEFWRVPIKCK
jgi:hypothetical protein